MSELPLDYVTYKPLQQQSNNSKSNRASASMPKSYKSIAVIFLAITCFLILGFQFDIVSFLSSSSSSSSKNTAPYVPKSILLNDHNDYGHKAEHKIEHFRPLVISGPSGVGKGTMINKLVEYYDHKVDEAVESHEFNIQDQNMLHDVFGFSVSHTTRKPRPYETDGVHYHFTTREQMMEDIKQNKFIEYAEVHGNLYGTSYESVQTVVNSQRICILDVDVQGAKRIKSDTTILTPYFVFISPPSMEVLEQRLRKRGTETEEAILKRLGNAQSEMDYGTTPGNFDQIIINDDMERSFPLMRSILHGWYPHLNNIPSPSYEF